jgi:hypothetical protein
VKSIKPLLELSECSFYTVSGANMSLVEGALGSIRVVRERGDAESAKMTAPWNGLSPFPSN